MNHCASIDIGTNSTRLLVADVSHTIQPLFYLEQLTKLGSGLQPDGRLSHEAMHRVLDVLIEFRQKLGDFQIEQTHVFATSATRDANNRGEFHNLIRQHTGWNCRVLSGEEEAELSFLGVISDLQVDGDYLVCDVGGGSSEFIVARQRRKQKLQSLDVGSNRLTRLFLKKNPPTHEQINQARQFVRAALLDVQVPSELKTIIAVGGTACSLALMDAHASIQTPQKAHHYKLQRHALDEWVNVLARTTVKQRQSITGLNPQRADVILGGGIIFTEILHHFGQPSMLVSLRDLLFGIFLEARDDTF